MNKNPVIVKTTVSTKQAVGRAERDLIRRHQAALKQIDRWDVAREMRPHTPKLANEVLRRDEAVNWEAPVIQAMARQAERVERPPMATRVRPPIQDFESLTPRIPEALATAALFALIAGAVLIAIGIS
jgi:hypothetical protein